VAAQTFLWSCNLNLKTVAGVALPASSFAHIGDEGDVSTWKLPIHFPNDVKKTVNHIKNAAHRFSEVKGIPEREESAVWRRIVAAARCHGIPVPAERPQRIQTEQATSPTQPQVPAAVAKKEQAPQPKAVSGGWAAWADHRADEFLKSLGLE
jgi:hypothetical protein